MANANFSLATFFTSSLKLRAIFRIRELTQLSFQFGASRIFLFAFKFARDRATAEREALGLLFCLAATVHMRESILALLFVVVVGPFYVLVQKWFIVFWFLLCLFHLD